MECCHGEKARNSTVSLMLFLKKTLLQLYVDSKPLILFMFEQVVTYCSKPFRLAWFAFLYENAVSYLSTVVTLCCIDLESMPHMT